jgi:hypothetical protein
MKLSSKSEYRVFEDEVYGYKLSGTYEYEPGGDGDYECPPYGPIVSIVEVFIDNNKNCALDLISPHVINSIEQHLMETL